MIYFIIALLTVIAVSTVSSFIFLRSFRKKEAIAKENAGNLIEKARAEAKLAVTKAMDEVAQFRLVSAEEMKVEKAKMEEDVHQLELRLEKENLRLNMLASETDKIIKSIDSRYMELKKVYNSTTDLKQDKRDIILQMPSALEQAAQTTAQSISEEITRRLVSQAESEAAADLRQWEEVPESEFTALAKRIMGIAIGRLGVIKAQERPPSIIAMTKSAWEKLLRVTGKENGFLTELFGMPLSIMENGDAFVIRFETLDAVKKEIARRVLEKLPDSVKNIDDLNIIFEKKSFEMENELIGFGRKAFKLAGIRQKADREIVLLLGRLFYRTSYTQNQWQHSIEASVLAGLMAHELHMDVETAKRATLLHDIGKALTHEIEGSHAEIGSKFAIEAHESPEVIEAITSHHGEGEQISLFTRIVMAADAMSGARPGARREMVESYMDRISDLENAALSFEGVREVFAVQAGRELRIMVDNTEVDDSQTAALAAGIATKISDEVTFPGQIKVMVIRRFKAVELAR
ncbi:HDIG domain-containing protein [Myxococcota bacterium]|nr:HDIG domain-containing protein [Myxococcota bacterium]MBU1381671.1 HDIG domain-containing protein [Myxococcota bacterium]MBU1496514.1 HDIG domain-containing protein [Myxococcota bacterium]